MRRHNLIKKSPKSISNKERKEISRLAAILLEEKFRKHMGFILKANDPNFPWVYPTKKFKKIKFNKRKVKKWMQF